MTITPKKIKCIIKCTFLILITTSFGIISVAIPITYLFRNDGVAFDFAGLAGLAGFATIYYGIVTKRELVDLKGKPEEDCEKALIVALKASPKKYLKTPSKKAFPKEATVYFQKDVIGDLEKDKSSVSSLKKLKERKRNP